MSLLPPTCLYRVERMKFTFHFPWIHKKTTENLFIRRTATGFSTTLLHEVRYTHRSVHLLIVSFPTVRVYSSLYYLRYGTSNPRLKDHLQRHFFPLPEPWPTRFEFLPMTDVSVHISIDKISSQMQEKIPNRKWSTFRSMLFPFAFVFPRLQPIIFIP